MVNAAKSIERNPSVNSTLVGPDVDTGDQVQIATQDVETKLLLGSIDDSLKLIIAILNKGYETDLDQENMEDGT